MIQKQSFSNFEERENYLRSLGAPIPRRHQGAGVFWNDLKSAARNSALKRRDYAFVAPNPLDGLAFDRVNLVLRALPATRESARDIESTIERFNLQHLTHRFVYSLSGGEALRLAMAKCALQWPVVKRLVLAAPWHGLSQGNIKYVNDISLEYSQRGKVVELLNLEGDDNFEVSSEVPPTEHDPVKFEFKLSSVRIALADPDKTTVIPFARVDDFEESLISPCLISGENGNGKSLLVKAIAGTIEYAGKIKVGTQGSKPVRLIFQDVSSQMLLGSATLHWELSNNKIAKYLYERLLEKLATLLPDVRRGNDTLLQTKAAMVALRLSPEPAALILDEPDWGLSNLNPSRSFIAWLMFATFKKRL